MRNTYSGEYPQDFAAISLAVREAAGWRCIRCWHPFAPDTGSPLFCDSACDTHRGIHRRALHDDDRQSQHIGPRVTRITAENRQWLGSLNYGVHHFDGDKANNRWWNLMAMCNSCHAWWFARREPTREEVQADASLFLAIGQPWLFPDRADQARAYITHGFLRATDPQILPFDDRHRDIVSMNSYEP
jgi:hypothetical protein